MRQALDAASAKERGIRTKQPVPVLVPRRNCCAVAQARNAAVLIDGANYFAALHSSLGRARKSIVIVGWDFDSSICLCPQDGTQAQPLGHMLRQLDKENPDLHVRCLIWSLAIFHAPSAVAPLVFGAYWGAHERFQLSLDTQGQAPPAPHFTRRSPVILRMTLAVIFAMFAYRAVRQSRPRDELRIRVAGLTEMKNPPRNWDLVDEIGDESFPASDPPATY